MNSPTALRRSGSDLSDDPAQAPAADGPQGSTGTESAPAASIHSHVLSVVASRICSDGDASGTDCLEVLTEALLASESAFDRALAQVRARHGANDAEIVDCYIPAVACRLGTDWTDNRRSFAEVTIGTARLIAAVRDLGRRWQADAVADWNAPAMAMVVPEAEQHRLGAMIAATRFRRAGVSVQLMLGRPDAEVVARIRDGDFDMVSFSLAARERVEQTRRLIQILRETVAPLPPIVVGGAVGACADELKLQLGADHVVSDPEEALRRCGVKVATRRNDRTAAGPPA